MSKMDFAQRAATLLGVAPDELFNLDEYESAVVREFVDPGGEKYGDAWPEELVVRQDGHTFVFFTPFGEPTLLFIKESTFEFIVEKGLIEAVEDTWELNPEEAATIREEIVEKLAAAMGVSQTWTELMGIEGVESDCSAFLIDVPGKPGLMIRVIVEGPFTEQS